ncbi:MAG: hypothetical protein ACTS5I_16635, partial [Rhodanobacter sp.]
PRRMLRHKAMIQCARLAFGFVGVYDPDEAERIQEATLVGDRSGRPDTTQVDYALIGQRYGDVARAHAVALHIRELRVCELATSLHYETS